MRRLCPLANVPVAQIGILVRDLDDAVDRYLRNGFGPWRHFTYGPDNVRTLLYWGQPGGFRVRVALSDTQPEIELLEALEGPSIYDGWLDGRSEGLHHLGFAVPSISDAIEAMEQAGFPLTQAGLGHGLRGDGGFAYFDTEPELGVILEALERPSVRREPELVR